MRTYKVFAKRPTFISDNSKLLYQSPALTIKAYDNETKAFTETYKKYRQGVKKVETQKSFESKIENLKMGTVSDGSFPIQKPSKADVTKILKDEAAAKLHDENPSADRIDQYVKSMFDKVEKDRIDKWNELKNYFNQLDQTRKDIERAALQQEFQLRKQNLLDMLHGEPYVIEKGMEELSKSIELPFDLDYTYNYYPNEGLIEVDAEIINDIPIPLQKAVLLASGRVSIKNKLVRELKQDTKDTVLSFIYLFTSKVFEISLNITRVQITLWCADKTGGYCWIEIPREGIMRDTPKYIVPAFDYINYKRVIDIRDKVTGSEINPIPVAKFKKQIEKEKSES